MNYKTVFITKDGTFVGWDEFRSKKINDESALEYAQKMGEPVGWILVIQILPKWKVGETKFIPSLIQTAIFPRKDV